MDVDRKNKLDSVVSHVMQCRNIKQNEACKVVAEMFAEVADRNYNHKYIYFMATGRADISKKMGFIIDEIHAVMDGLPKGRYLWDNEYEREKEKVKEKIGNVEQQLIDMSRYMPEKKICAFCKKEFKSTGSNNRFCSRECSLSESKRGRYIILERDRFKCFYCGASPREDGIKLEIDHVRPVSKGGDNRADNLVTSCKPCNSQKHNKEMSEESYRSTTEAIKSRNKNSGIRDSQVIGLRR